MGSLREESPACHHVRPALQLAPAKLRQRALQALNPEVAGKNPVMRQLLALEQAGQWEIERLRRELAPSAPGPAMPGPLKADRHLTTCIPAQALGGLSSSSNTASASLSWSRLREVSARWNRH